MVCLGMAACKWVLKCQRDPFPTVHCHWHKTVRGPILISGSISVFWQVWFSSDSLAPCYRRCPRPPSYILTVVWRWWVVCYGHDQRERRVKQSTSLLCKREAHEMSRLTLDYSVAFHHLFQTPKLITAVKNVMLLHFSNPPLCYKSEVNATTCYSYFDYNLFLVCGCVQPPPQKKLTCASQCKPKAHIHMVQHASSHRRMRVGWVACY